MSSDVKAILRTLVKESRPNSILDDDDDDDCEGDDFGGNVDDAYSAGLKDGRTALARELIEKLHDNMKKNKKST